METIQTVQEHKPKFFNLPFWVLPRLRTVFAKWLVEKDGTREIGPTPAIPQQLFEYLNGLDLFVLFLISQN